MFKTYVLDVPDVLDGFIFDNVSLSLTMFYCFIVLILKKGDSVTESHGAVLEMLPHLKKYLLLVFTLK